jgi:hypothetical protein
MTDGGGEVHGQRFRTRGAVVVCVARLALLIAVAVATAVETELTPAVVIVLALGGLGLWRTFALVLVADDDGVTVHNVLYTRRVAWSDVERITWNGLPIRHGRSGARYNVAFLWLRPGGRHRLSATWWFSPEARDDVLAYLRAVAPAHVTLEPLEPREPLEQDTRQAG